MSPDPVDVVTRFCKTWESVDIDALMEFFADDAVYHNIPLAPVVGKDTVRTTIEGFTAGVDRIEFELLAVAVAGNTVLTERVDRFVRPDATIALPVMGAFDVVDGKITAWRDYFDLQQFMSQL